MKLREILVKSFAEQNGLQRFAARKLLFKPLEAIGFHIVGDHFYEPIPNLREVKRSYDENYFRLPAGKKYDLKAGAERQADMLKNFGEECRLALCEAGFGLNPYFRHEDAVTLYCLLRSEQIRAVVEVGQGYSTLVSLAALRENAAKGIGKTSFISIDPFDRLGCQGNRPAASTHNISLERKRIQDVDPETICSHLGPGSLLFVDSTHVFKSGSDVEYLMREVYPRIPAGTILHIHDIYTPYRIPKQRIVEDKLFFSEQDHLESFLEYNAAFEIHTPVFWLFRDRPELRNMLQESGHPMDLPGNSFYIKRVI